MKFESHWPKGLFWKEKTPSYNRINTVNESNAKGVNTNILTCAIEDTVKILKFGTPQTTAIIVIKIEKFDVTLH